MHTVRTRTARTLAPLTALALTAALAGCASDAEAGADDAGTEQPEQHMQADALSVTDPWVKAVDEGMTSAFGTLVNDSDTDVVVTSAQTDVAGMVELHEVVTDDSGSMTMQEKDGGFVVPAGGEHELAPGGDHVMLMDLTGPIEPGVDVSITLVTEDGSELEVTAPARSFSGAQEEYDPESEMDEMDHEDMDHSDHEEDSDS
ncbi:hypothetical protein GCM10023216_00230 [Isoptericola chiayiensis]|uniref:Copper chaperone PCu(A)C n=1 Tax=Isoptericola chiayiensis TaxID=579446 RepID=A0ABP8XWH2_9MICO|nr:hypothetical protein [Isoptericola chiayiensis]